MKKLKPFQEWAFKKLMSAKIGGLFLNMGLGKTVITCHYILKRKFKYTLVVCPKIIIDQWLDEIEETMPDHDTVTIEAKSAKRLEEYISEMLKDNKKRKEDTPTVFVTNYEFVRARKKLFIKLADLLQCVILDESNYIQSRKAAVTKACIKIFQSVEYKLILTGTPFLKILNIYSQMMFVDLHFWRMNYWGWFNTYVNFVEEEIYVRGKVVRFKKVIGPNEAMLPRLLKKLRTQGNIIFTEDIGGSKLLPKQSIMPLGIELEENLMEEYNLFKADLISNVGEVENSIHQSAKMIKLQQILAGVHLKKDSNKFKMLTNLIENEIDTDKTPVLIWCRFRNTMAMLEAKLKQKYKDMHIFCIHGDVNKANRKDILKYINSNANSILLMQIQVGRFGIDLKNISAGIFYELDFSLMNYNQAKSRIRRLSSKGSSTNYILYYKATVGNYIFNALKQGLKEADLVRSVYKQIIKQ